METNIETKDREKLKDYVSRLVDLLISRTINEIQTRAVNLFTALGTLGLTDDEIVARLSEQLDEQSLKVFESFASQSANAAINAGRKDEMEARADDIVRYEWSAILDKGTCDPCEELDGQTGTDITDLPDAPLDGCEGGASCRCFVIAVGIEGNA